MKVHFIAIGGAVMHNLAIVLQQKGHEVTGSDDEIFEPARSRLKDRGLLPGKTGWNPDRITSDIDLIILGMHARLDNPELNKALSLQIPIYSFPEFLYEQTKSKKRAVIGGSHGKTTITSMIMHVLKACHIRFDYMVGSRIEGFDTMVGFSDESGLAVFEGDEYLSSALDRRPKFHLYKPNIALLTGIAWDHMNVFPEFETYLNQFRLFIETIQPGGTLIYYKDDPVLAELVRPYMTKLNCRPYEKHPYEIRNGNTYLVTPGKTYECSLFGQHNMQNISGARIACNALGIADTQFYPAIRSFPGAKKRLQLLAQNISTSVYLDFAHAPSKVSATTLALKEQFPERKLTAVLELHTYSSLNAEFIPLYSNSLDSADTAMVFFNPETLARKKLPPLSSRYVIKAFGRPGLQVYTDTDLLIRKLKETDWEHANLLFMSSGNFDGRDLEKLALEITGKT